MSALADALQLHFEYYLRGLPTPGHLPTHQQLAGLEQRLQHPDPATRIEALTLVLHAEALGPDTPERLDPLIQDGFKALHTPQQAERLVPLLLHALQQLPAHRQDPLRDALASAAAVAGIYQGPFGLHVITRNNALTPLQPQLTQHLLNWLHLRAQTPDAEHFNPRADFEALTPANLQTAHLLLALMTLAPKTPIPHLDALLDTLIHELQRNPHTATDLVAHETDRPTTDPNNPLLVFSLEQRERLLCALDYLLPWSLLQTAPTPRVAQHIAQHLARISSGQRRSQDNSLALPLPDHLVELGPHLTPALLPWLPILPTPTPTLIIPFIIHLTATVEHASDLLAIALTLTDSTCRNLLLLTLTRLGTHHLTPALAPHLTPDNLPTLLDLACTAAWRHRDTHLAKHLLLHATSLDDDASARLQSAAQNPEAPLIDAAPHFIAARALYQRHLAYLDPGDPDEDDDDAEALDEDAWGEDGWDEDDWDEDDWDEEAEDEDDWDSWVAPNPLIDYTPPQNPQRLRELLAQSDEIALAAASDTWTWPRSVIDTWAHLTTQLAPSELTDDTAHPLLAVIAPDTLHRAALLIWRHAPPNTLLRDLLRWLTLQNPNDTDLHLDILQSTLLTLQDVAVAALLKNQADDAAPRLLALLKHKRAPVRAAAARALEQRQDDVLDALRDALRTEKAKAAREALQSAIQHLDPSLDNPRAIAADAGTWSRLDDLDPRDLLAQLRHLLHQDPTPLSFARAIDLIARLYLLGDPTPGVHYLLGHGLAAWPPELCFLPLGFDLDPRLLPLHSALAEHTLDDPRPIAPIALLHTPLWRVAAAPHLDTLTRNLQPRDFTALLHNLADTTQRAVVAAWAWCREHSLPIDSLQLQTDLGPFNPEEDYQVEWQTLAFTLHSGFAAHLRLLPLGYGGQPGLGLRHAQLHIPARHPVRSRLDMGARQRVLLLDPAWLHLDTPIPRPAP